MPEYDKSNPKIQEYLKKKREELDQQMERLFGPGGGKK